MESEDWITGRARLGDALLGLVDAGHELGIADEEVALWRRVADCLDDSLLLLLTGEQGGGKTSLAGALVQDDFSSGGDFAVDCPPDLVMWKYGQEPMVIADSGLEENYRPVNGLKNLEFVEVAPRARGSATGAMERAYMMADLVVMVFSAADPWGEQQWQFLADMHGLRGQAVAVVLTHAEQRTEEELNAIVDHLCKRAQQVTGQQAGGFIFSTSSILAALRGRAEEGSSQEFNRVEDLRQWLIEVSAAQAEASIAGERVQSVIKVAARSVGEGFDKAQGDCDSEAECIRWIENELERQASRATALIAEETSGLLESYQGEMLNVRERLARQVGLLGAAGSLFQGGEWINTELQRVAGLVAGEVEAGLRGSIARVEDCLAGCRCRINERVAGVFGEGVLQDCRGDQQGPQAGECIDGLGRRVHLRVHEALEDREEATAIRAILGWRRMILWVSLAGLGVGAERAWALKLWSGHVEGLNLVLLPGACLVAFLWLLVYLRIKKRRILALYDRFMGTARSRLERRIEEIHGARVELLRQDLPGLLRCLRARAAELTAKRRHCREKAAQAISLAQEL